MKKIILGVLLSFILNIISGCTLSTGKNISNEVIKPSIKAANYPLYYFAHRIVGEKMKVESLVPLGVDPHSWEPTPSDLVGLEKTSILLFNGAGMEDWIVKIADVLKNENLQVVNATEGIQLLKGQGDNHGHGEDEKEKGQEQEKFEEEFDPHVWLDPINSKVIAHNIKNAIIKEDPANEDYYEENYYKLIKELDQLDKAFKEGLQDITRKEFIVNHAAFGYLAKRYGLIQIPIMGINPHTEPTPKRMVELINVTKEHKLKYIFTESLISSKVADVLAREAGINTKVLNPLGNLTKEDIEAGKDYFTIMYENLMVLKEALK